MSCPGYLHPRPTDETILDCISCLREIHTDPGATESGPPPGTRCSAWRPTPKPADLDPDHIECSSVVFAQLARAINLQLIEWAYQRPRYRSPPRDPGLNRSLRRVHDGVVISVKLKDRHRHDVMADMIDGALAANGISYSHDDYQLRSSLLHTACQPMDGTSDESEPTEWPYEDDKPQEDAA